MSVIKMQRRPGGFKDRLKNDSFLGDPNYPPPVGPNVAGTPFDYRVSKDEITGKVVLHLGSIQPFAIDPHSAAKLAMLLLKYAGNDAAVNTSIMVLRAAGIIEAEKTDGQE